ncbi:methyl-accepting chemotaxis protein [Virgibacillus sp. W0430]|uniref:methyl-accepting chemotaxis protein n=1 Tax=Virgibacillus sp. W0430 TaxID=3391580 RepID=UPI003F44C6C4
MRKKYRFNLRRKLVLFTTVLAIITYSCSAAFIYLIYDYIQSLLAIPEQLYIIVVLVLGIIWSGILAFIAARIITKPLQELEVAATNAAEGDLRQTINIPKSDDEIRSLSIAFDSMLKNITNIVHNIETNFEHTNKNVIQMKKVANEAAQHSEMISSSSDDISKGAVSSAEAIQETAEAVEEATNLAEEVQMKADQSKQKSNEMLKTLNKSKDVVNSLVEGIQTLATEQEASLKDVEHLKQNAQQVESIITMVGEIAEQTNLLALNASIEAARAGEHGRGFAVVAEEIRKLADQSAQAVQRISDLIVSIQNGVSLVVKQINDNVDHANKEAESGANTNNAIEQMSGSVNDVAAEVDTITTLVTKQLQSIQATVKQSQEVAAIAEETSAASEEVNAAVQEQSSTIEEVDALAKQLEEQAQNLKKQINQFKM